MIIKKHFTSSKKTKKVCFTRTTLILDKNLEFIYLFDSYKCFRQVYFNFKTDKNIVQLLTNIKKLKLKINII